ncbi:hypothetical protein N8542_02550 [Verrucomicrobia bacterium]|jgi:hypothetical protein|nr:hypothetical protein [Verrucomicrobiota bacterium]|tara:strand:- start:273 stop:569 length:297 start_codon:yes stop_codon:yes gene_type:complete
MQEVVRLISELGLPVAGGLVMSYFIFLVMKQLMDGLVSEIQTVQAISKMLITRASTMNNDMIRIDTSVSSALNLSPDLDRIARAENFVEDGKIDARRD